MLTPAEELGLSGLSLASRVRKAFYGIPEPRLAEMIQLIHDEAANRHLVYLRDGEIDVIRIMPCPVTVLPDQLAYVHYVSLTIQNALKRLPELYMQDFAVRDVLQVSPDEEEWLWKCWGPSQRENNPVFGRLDAMVDFINPMWKDSLRFVEPNLSGIGGLHLVPTCEGILADVVLPVLHEYDPQLRLEHCKDIRELLMQEVLDHLAISLGHQGRINTHRERLAQPVYIHFHEPAPGRAGRALRLQLVVDRLHPAAHLLGLLNQRAKIGQIAKSFEHLNISNGGCLSIPS